MRKRPSGETPADERRELADILVNSVTVPAQMNVVCSSHEQLMSETSAVFGGRYLQVNFTDGSIYKQTFINTCLVYCEIRIFVHSVHIAPQQEKYKDKFQNGNFYFITAKYVLRAPTCMKNVTSVSRGSFRIRTVDSFSFYARS